MYAILKPGWLADDCKRASVTVREIRKRDIWLELQLEKARHAKEVERLGTMLREIDL